MKYKLSITIVASLLIHLVLLALLAYFSKVSIQPEQHKQIIQAKLFFPPKPKPDPKPKTDPKPKPTQPKKPVLKAVKDEVEVVVEIEVKTPQVKSKSLPKAKPQTKQIQKLTETSADNSKAVIVEKTKNPVRGRFNPYASIDKMMAAETEDYVNSIDIAAILKKAEADSIKSINSSNGLDMEPLFESQIIIDHNTRIINYNGTCMQVQRVLDFNGFSQFSWSGTSLSCGNDKGMQKQLKLSLEKFIKPKRKAPVNNAGRATKMPTP